METDQSAAQQTKERQPAPAILTRMLHRRHMPLYLLAAWTLLDAAVIAWTTFVGGPWEQEYPMLFLLLWGQFIAVSGWIVVGDRSIKASLAIVLIAAIAFNSLQGLHGPFETVHAPTMIGLAFTALYAALLNLPLIIARLTGWRFAFAPEPRPQQAPLYQFSIREIMLYMVLVGVVAGLWAATRPASSDRILFHELIWRGFLAVALLASAVPWSLWAAFAWSRPIHGGLMALLVSGFWVVAIIRLLANPPPGILLFFVPSAVLIVHVLALQAAGFRLSRSEYEAPSPPDPGPDWDNAELWKKLAKPGSRDAK